MAAGPTLPPQAYTREVLTAAFNWLQTQPESVRKLATTPDALVGLFMRAQRFGASSLEADAPVSSQAFISDLKNLAEGLKQFDDPKDLKRTPTTAAPHLSSPHPSQSLSAAAQASIHNMSNAMGNGLSGFNPAMSAPTHTSHQSSALNERSLAMIQEVKNELNLSSDAEAVNMMLALAYKNLRNLLA